MATDPPAETKGGYPPKEDAAPSVPFVEKSKEELDKLSKDDRRAYYQAKLAAEKAQKSAGAGSSEANPKASQPLTKADRRKIQEAQRKTKEDKANEGKEGDELFAELKLQGLSEDQAREVMREMLSGAGGGDEAGADDDEEDVEDLLGSVRKWMEEQPTTVAEDALRDFNMKVRFQGHVDSTPPDHLSAILQVLVGQACGACDLSAKNFQPNSIAKVLQPLLERWAPLLLPLHGKIADVLDAVNAVISGITTAVVATGAPETVQETAVVGSLMAVREIDDLVEDDDLLVGCKGIENRGRITDKFIEFLESCLEDEEDDEDEDDQ
jgi:hypothetical protein